MFYFSFTLICASSGENFGDGAANAAVEAGEKNGARKRQGVSLACAWPAPGLRLANSLACAWPARRLIYEFL